MPSRYGIVKDALLRHLYEMRQYNAQFFYRGNDLPDGFVQFLEREKIALDRRTDAVLVQEAFWGLVADGLVMPGSRNGQGNSLPWVTITDYGIQCVEEGRRLPIDDVGFIEEMDLGQVDEVIRLYVEEAVSSFSARNYLASSVMAGGAMERTILVLTEQYENKLATAKRSTYKKDVLSQERIKTRFDKFLSFLESTGIKKALPRATQETLDSTFPAIVNFIRITRNEVGHPTGREISRDEAESMIYLLKTAIQFTKQLLT